MRPVVAGLGVVLAELDQKADQRDCFHQILHSNLGLQPMCLQSSFTMVVLEVL